KGAPDIYLLTSVLRERKVKGCAFIDFPFGPDPAAVPVDDPLHDGQANSGAFIFLVAVQTLEDTEQLLTIALIKAHPIVLNVADLFPALGVTVHFNGRLLFGPGI